MSGVCTEPCAHELGMVGCNVSFPSKNTCLGRYLEGKDIPSLTTTTLGELKGKIPHFLV